VTAATAAPRHVLVNGHRIRFRFVQQIAWSAAAATIGAYMVSAVYYLLFETRWHAGGHTILYLKPRWDHLLSYRWWQPARHDIRDVYEGVFATLFVRSLVAKWRRYHGARVGPVRMALSPLVIFLAALPVVLVGIWLIDISGPALWHHIAGHRVLHAHVALPGWLSAYLSLWNWQPLLIGIAAGLVVHRVYRPVGNTVQLVMVERAVSRARRTGRQPVWVRLPLMPPVVRERFCYLTDDNIPVESHGRWIAVVTPVMVTVLFLLAAYGAYVRLIIAHGR